MMQDRERLVIAYEPVWAIGTGRNATDAQAQEVHAFIRQTLAKMWNPDFADRVRIQYGGSMKPENAKGLLESARRGWRPDRWRCAESRQFSGIANAAYKIHEAAPMAFGELQQPLFRAVYDDAFALKT